MKRIVFVEVLAVFLLAGCMVGHGPHGGGVVVVPALPSIVVLEAEPYYQHSGYYYYYQNDRWSYSHSRSGPWMELPRDRYPKEVKFKGRGAGKSNKDDKGNKSNNGDTGNPKERDSD